MARSELVACVYHTIIENEFEFGAKISIATWILQAFCGHGGFCKIQLQNPNDLQIRCKIHLSLVPEGRGSGVVQSILWITHPCIDGFIDRSEHVYM